MKPFIGVWFTFTAIIFGCICLFGFDMSLKEKVVMMGTFEIFLTFLMIGLFLFFY